MDNDPASISRYPYSAFLGDWLTGLTYWLTRVSIDLIHASPPCQAYSKTARLHPKTRYPDLIPAVRGILMETEIPWVLENVPEAPLLEPVYLCGSMFGLHGFWNGQMVGLDRERGFEATFPLVPPLDCSCDDYLNVPVFGHGCPGPRKRFKGPGFAELTREVMGIDWMTRDGLTEAIPPRYAEYVGYSFQVASGNMVNVRNSGAKARHMSIYDHAS